MKASLVSLLLPLGEVEKVPDEDGVVVRADEEKMDVFNV